MYCRKMTTHTSDDKHLIYYFQESLTGAPLRWYVQLEGCHIRTWRDLTIAFLTQYKHVIELELDRLAMLAFEKGANESFKIYVRRWREAAMEVQSSLTKKRVDHNVHQNSKRSIL